MTCMNKLTILRSQVKLVHTSLNIRFSGILKEEKVMGKYEQDARLLLEYVGGKENIAAVSHCVSRIIFWK